MFRNWSSLGLASLTLGLLTAVFIVVLASGDSEEDDGPSSLDNGLGSHIEWETLDDGLSRAKQEKKPLMLIIHKSWCGACKSLKPKFRESKKIANLSQKFIMVNTMDEDEPPGDEYRPDGGYVPRILFFDPDGDLLKTIINEEGNPDYKYYYYDELSILTSMEKVAALYPASSSNDVNANDSSASDKNQGKTEL